MNKHPHIHFVVSIFTGNWGDFFSSFSREALLDLDLFLILVSLPDSATSVASFLISADSSRLSRLLDLWSPRWWRFEACLPDFLFLGVLCCDPSLSELSLFALVCDFFTSSMALWRSSGLVFANSGFWSIIWFSYASVSVLEIFTVFLRYSAKD